MTRNIKALGLALVAVFALSAMAVSAAQAREPVVTLKDGSGTTVNTATITGEDTGGTHVFNVEGNTVTCNTVEFNGNIEDAKTNTFVHPTYQNCTAFGFIGANVNTTNCNYRLMPNPENENMVWGGEIEVICNSGSITINAGGVCEAKVNGGTLINTGNKVTVLTNSPEDLLLHNEASEVATEKTLDGFGCPFNGTGKVTANYTGTTTVRAYKTALAHNTANQVNLTLSTLP